jgi:hypothetical protein
VHDVFGQARDRPAIDADQFVAMMQAPRDEVAQVAGDAGDYDGIV